MNADIRFLGLYAIVAPSISARIVREDDRHLNCPPHTPYAGWWTAREPRTSSSPFWERASGVGVAGSASDRDAYAGRVRVWTWGSALIRIGTTTPTQSLTLFA